VGGHVCALCVAGDNIDTRFHKLSDAIFCDGFCGIADLSGAADPDASGFKKRAVAKQAISLFSDVFHTEKMRRKPGKKPKLPPFLG